MNDISSEEPKKRPDAFGYEIEFLNWLEATYTLHTHYKTLSNIFRQGPLDHPEKLPKSAFVGQCPTAELVFLMRAMETELQTLIQDLGTLNAGSICATNKDHKKLVAHTLILNRLNQQAQIRLLLTTIKAS